MKLIIGGAYQGKRAYASLQYHLNEIQWADGELCEPEDLYQAGAVNHFHQLIRRFPESDWAGFAQELYRQNPQIVIVTNEVGYGIVPMEKEERVWRELCGRTCTILASFADEVVRVCCGIGGRIK